MLKAGPTTLIPTFSLISRHGDESPLLMKLVRRSRKSPERYVIDYLIQPYVKALSHLLFEEGLHYEGHPQTYFGKSMAATS